MSVGSDLEHIFQRVLDDPKLRISDAMTARDHEKWDSLAQIDLVVESERHFGVRFTTAELGSLANVGEFIAAIEKKVRATGSPGS